MRTILKAFLILVITIIILAIALAAYIMIKNPLGLRDAFMSSYVTTNIENNDEDTQGDSSAAASTYDHPLLSDEQEARAAKVGIDVSKLPTEITAEQQTCVNNKLGAERVAEIIKGAEPSPLEIIRVAPCF
jgi:hypothetical protein